MAAFDITSKAGPGPTVGSRLTQFVATIGGSVKTWNDARLTRKALHRLSDRALSDIGLTRGDIGTFPTRRRA